MTGYLVHWNDDAFIRRRIRTGELVMIHLIHLKLADSLTTHFPVFYARCDHYLLLLPEFTPHTQRTAAVKLHADARAA
uniref:Transposase n=1 Tax=Loa loa TaxID=7209 RepID=A0A1I7VJ70_LOALO